ncbi:MAG: hypothetical protein JST77_15895 [Acidobacteria bacterium]|nr:hypothetical protein [Acidobacteriota bacterium]
MDDNTPKQTPYEGPRAAFHTLVVGRIYHEDMLFAQRSYILLGVHAFLMTAFTVLVTGKESAVTQHLAIALTSFGCLLGIFQASFGRQTGRAIGFWRRYLRLIEKQWQIAFDHLQYDFYTNGIAVTPFGVICKKKLSQKALYDLYERTRFLTSITTVVGFLFPMALALFWAIGLGYFLSEITHRYWAGVLGFGVLVFVELAVLWPSLAEADTPEPQASWQD